MAAESLEWVKPMLVDKFLGPNSLRMTASVTASTIAMGAAKILAPGKEAAKDVIAQSKNLVAVNDGDAKLAGRKPGGSAPKTAAAVDRRFIRNFTKLIKIALPDLQTSQGGYVALLSLFLLLRTGLTLKISALTGEIGMKMVETEAKPLAIAVLKLALWSVPASFVNSALKYLTSLLEVSFRRNLTKYFHRRYLSQQNFYKCVGLGAVDSVEQRITQDIQKFSAGAADLYTTLFKPVVDILLFARQIASHGGWRGPSMVILWYSMVTFVIRALAPNFALLTSIQQQKEGRLRGEHTKLIEFAEEVTMSQGESSTLKTLNFLFGKSQAHILYAGYMRAKNGVLDGILVKYGSVMVGYAACSLSIFSPEAAKMNSSELTGLYVHTSQLLINLARAIGQLIMTYRTVANLAGFTHRVYELEEGLNQVEKRVREQNKEKQNKAEGGNTGTVVTGSQSITFTQVPIVSPDKTVLIKSLSFSVEPGMNLLIVGPNGCGKSSTFRLLGELWPIYGGKIEKPGFEQLYYVPQRPYMSSGTLRDQVIYPTEAKDLKVGEDKLYECLKMASLEGLLNQPGVSWGCRQNWAGEALSMGQKQKLAMARLFFHKPRFAILDECTSAIDLDIEQSLYTHCRHLGISLITIAHRRSLWKYHNWVLRFDGDGGYMFSPLEFSDDDEMILSSVVHASDESKVGQRIVITLHHSKDEVNAEDARRESALLRKEAERKEAERKAAEQREAERKAAEQREAERKEADRLETEKKAQERQEAERKEAERLDAERKEEERKEVERKAQELQEEAERREAAKKEAEKQTEASEASSAPSDQAAEPEKQDPEPSKPQAAADAGSTLSPAPADPKESTAPTAGGAEGRSVTPVSPPRRNPKQNSRKR